MLITKDYLFLCVLLLFIPFYGLDNYYIIIKFLLLILSFFLIRVNIKNNFRKYLLSLLVLLTLAIAISSKLPTGFIDGLLDIIILFNFSKLKRIIISSKLTFLKHFSLLIVSIIFLRMFMNADSINILNNRFEINGLDPNLSAVLFFLLYIFMVKIKYKFGAVVVLLSFFLTLSRNFLLGVIVFHSINYLSKNYFFYKYLKKITPIYFMFLLNLFLFLIVFYTTYLFDIDSNSVDAIAETDSLDRVSSLNDGSNFGRFLIIYRAIENVYMHPESFLFGLEKRDFNSSPHNTIINLVIYKGFFFTIIVLNFVIKTFKNLFLSNESIIIAFIIMSLFLHSMFNTIYISLLFVFLSTNFNYTRHEIS